MVCGLDHSGSQPFIIVKVKLKNFASCIYMCEKNVSGTRPVPSLAIYIHVLLPQWPGLS